MRKIFITLLLLSNSFFETAVKADDKKWKNKKAEEADAKKTIKKLYPECCQRYNEFLSAGLSQDESLNIVIKTNAGKKIENIERRGLFVSYFFS